MKVYILMTCCLAVAFAKDHKSDLKQTFEDFKLKYNKVYEEGEHEFRFKIFVENLRKIYLHNQEYEQGKTTFKLGVNKFADLLHSEFAEMVLMKPRRVEIPDNLSKTQINTDLPDSFDWRPKGAVTDVKDQGGCGSCWSFSATGTVEGMNFIKNGKLVSLSEQNLMDCTWDYGNLACSGGEEREALNYIVDNGGIDTEEAYPYEERSSRTCKYDKNNIGASITGYETLKKGDEEDLKNAVATAGPVSIAIDVEFSFQLYESGVYEEKRCNPNYLNHAVLAVGYGTDEQSGKDYWLVKNSWGAGWGEDGYIRMVRNADNNCGVASECYYPNM